MVASLGGWSVADSTKKKIGPHLRDADGRAIDDKPHLYVGRMCAVALFRYHERNPDTQRPFLC